MIALALDNSHEALRNIVQHSYKNLIGGNWTTSGSEQTFGDYNPADRRELIANFPVSSTAAVEQATAAAQAALPQWMATPAPLRSAIILKAVSALRARAEEIASVLTWEEGKIRAEARTEVNRGLAAMEYLAAEGKRFFGQTIPSEHPQMFVWTQRRPVGVVGIITPWNFPFAIPAWKLATALVAGNTVVLKPAELAPLCAQFLVEALHDADLPPGTLNLVHGGPTVGEAIVRDRHVRAISFTGSTEVGKLINRYASERMAKVQLEMGGKNACIVLADADLTKAAREIVTSAFGSTGQRCTATSRVIADRNIHEALVEKLLAASREVTPGDGFKEATVMGPLIDENALKKTEHYVELACQEGNKLLLGGKRARDPELAHGYFFEATIIADVKPEDTLNREEVFGPVLAILAADGLEEALRMANVVDYGLSSALYTKNIAAGLSYANQAASGLLHVNCPTVFSEVHLPFGGIKESGFGGREMGPAASDFYTEWQTMYVNYSS
ncbi:MAG: aldehyde dehydrogenase family protein [Cyanobacteria bacterium NC_groundwater_1444_Ag_S-0.65um_54_12]|nr:aldehyde dehydrogenase family protein [Cyanobacteria bacterium NC_groundwater_1444_Ag_S-0.65um_54_12]